MEIICIVMNCLPLVYRQIDNELCAVTLCCISLIKICFFMIETYFSLSPHSTKETCDVTRKMTVIHGTVLF